ncbi:type II secretion system F family protein [Streptomyces sp. NPDC058469]|uniref:type II secretion system F family protein n=1 Tax=Streptomyces sp. NPDC058469 TaxID=3346514 RepID=UPI0036530892
MAAAGSAGLVVGVATGWVVGGLWAAVATWTLPRILGTTGVSRRDVERVEGIAGWTEMLRDTLAAAAGLEQSIMATAHTAPIGVRPQIQGLAVRLASGRRLAAALRQLADELADSTADLVIGALILASEHQARHLASLLGELAATARTQVEMRQRVEASRARTRTTVRVVVTTTLVFAGGLVLLNPVFLEPYDTATGQLVLLLIGTVFSTAFAWLNRMSRIEQPERFLAPRQPTGGSADAIDGARREASR